jgi:hypothetical protein
MDHSYEEIRATVFRLLKHIERNENNSSSYDLLSEKNALSLTGSDNGGTVRGQLSYNDALMFQEIFWDLFRQGIIVFGSERNPSQGYPAFRITRFGKKIIEEGNSYFFHDLASYEKIIRDTIPDIDDLTIFYLKEAMQAFMVECRLSSAVMLGVALEYSLDMLYSTISKNGTYSSHFQSVFKEPTLLRKFNKLALHQNEWVTSLRLL